MAFYFDYNIKLHKLSVSSRISTYSTEKEFTGWDLWGRKYVLLGLQYYLEICTDESLSGTIVDAMMRQADYILAHIGSKHDGKKPINNASNHWRGLNSSSILEPMVRLYNITGERKYLDFAEYIVREGGTSVFNVFRKAEEDIFLPYQYPITKAYEMISCFEGLLEFYRVRKEEWQLTALRNFANRILETDFTIIGCSGCSSELFDHSSVRQSNPDNPAVMQETCVTVTLMKFFYQMNLLTGDARYADAFEISFHNAYLGSFNTERQKDPSVREIFPDAKETFLPFDSYSPLAKGHRGNGVGGLKQMPDGSYYGCCACIASLGIGLYPKMALLRHEGGYALNLFSSGTYQASDLRVEVSGKYPADGEIQVRIKTDVSGKRELLIRNPSWSKKTVITAENAEIRHLDNGYISVTKEWKDDTIRISFDEKIRVMRTERYGKELLMNKVIWGQNYMIQTLDRENPEAKNHIALCYGPIALAMDENLGYDIDECGAIDLNRLDEGVKEEDAEHALLRKVSLVNGGNILLMDYASAGKRWNDGKRIAVWINNKKTGDGA